MEFGTIESLRGGTQERLQKRLEIFLKLFFSEIAYTFKTFGKRICEIFQKRSSVIKVASQVDAVALVVFFHGLNGKESVWDGHLREFKRQNAPVELMTPRLPKKVMRLFMEKKQKS